MGKSTLVQQVTGGLDVPETVKRLWNEGARKKRPHKTAFDRLSGFAANLDFEMP
jgi:hypothetical protein